MFFLKGLLIGFSIAAPVGPIGVLCIQRTLQKGRTTGLCTGLGAATADALYGAVAAFGLTFVSQFLLDQRQLLGLVGGAFLLYLGIRTLLSQPADKSVQGDASSLLASYLTTVGLTLSNPTTILSFVAIFAGLGLASSAGNTTEASLMVLGVFLGSAAWWLLLSGAVSILRTRLTQRHLLWVNRFSGTLILAFGVWSLATSVR